MIIAIRPAKRVMRLLVIVLSSLSLSACNPLTDLIFDCIDDDGPVLSPRIIPNPVLNQSYDVRITASIQNEPYDDSFQYDINVSQTLPPGLVVDVFERQIRITGAATELGSYAFDVSVAVEDPYRNHNVHFDNDYDGTTSGLCRYHIQRTYHLNVIQGN